LLDFFCDKGAKPKLTGKAPWLALISYASIITLLNDAPQFKTKLTSNGCNIDQGGCTVDL
jgi:hypothetical protein